ncbi:MAG: ABC transporter substrate-binding protein [Deltaproteobacteria bacterium]
MKRLVVLLAALAGTAHAELRPRYGGSVEATLLGGPATFDPVAAKTHAELTVIGLVFDTLYVLGPDGAARPHLAAALPVFDEKRTTARIQLEKGVVFQDGTALTAQDVAASLERARMTLHYALPIVTAIHADGDGIELSLAAPPGDLAQLLALPQLSITKAGRAPASGKVIGSGPFAIEQAELAHHRLALRAFDNHFAGRPFIDRLELRWYDTADGEARRFETGNAHTSSRGVAAFAGGTPTFAARDVAGPTALLVYVGFGAAHPALERDPAFRRALDLGLARGGLAQIGSGEQIVPTRVPVPNAMPLDSAGKTGDLDQARAQLAEAAKHTPELARPGAVRLEILVEDTRPDDRDIAERVGLALDKLGIAWTVTQVTAQVLRERVGTGKVDLWIGQLVEPVAATRVWWGAAFAAGGDAWPVSALQTNTLDLVAAEKAFAQRVPIVPLLFRSVRLWYRTDLHGIAFDALGRPCFEDAFLFGSPVPSRGKP